VLLDGVEAGGLWSVWGGAPDDVWVVGGVPEAGAVLRGDGRDFDPQEDLPAGTPQLHWVHGLGPDDVWVAGLAGTILRWDGSDWQDHSVGVEEALWGIHAVSEDEVYAVGGASAWGGDLAVAWRFDGAAWTAIELPETAAGLPALFKTTWDGERLWMVGAEGAALVGRGEDFEIVPTGIAEDLSTVSAVDDGRVLAVGGGATGVVVAGDASGLERIAQTRSRLFGVQAYASGSALLCGARGYLGRWDPERAEVVELRSPTEQLLHASWGLGGERSFVVGGTLESASGPFTGVLLSARSPR
jgi:hypothetical protein